MEMKHQLRDDTLSILRRLETVALSADIASHYVQDMRVMPASGVARIAWDAMDHIRAMEAQSREDALQCLSDIGQMAETIDKLEAKLAKAISAFEQIEAGVVPETDPDTGIWIECNMSEDEMQDIARTTLAELKEQNDA
jgi:hypothetical protein